MKKSAFLFSLVVFANQLFAQGTFSGDLMMNLNFFQRDTSIKASGNPLYDNALSGSEGWLNLRYNTNGFTFFVRADAFGNSNLKNPIAPSTDFGIGAWSITKELNDLTITVGSIYDQVGSGILFRSYEDRGLLIDNALMGLELKYKLTKDIMLKGFVGQQKNNTMVNNLRYGPVLKGFNAEGDYSVGKVHLAPGIGVLNRTLDAGSMAAIVNTINAQDSNRKFSPKYNMYAFTVYNMLTYKNFSWYIEAAYKTHEAVSEQGYYAPGVTAADSAKNYLLFDKPGNIQYTSINYGKKGIAIGISAKRTQDFVMRTSPNENLLNGMLNWQPVVAVLRPERLIARYTPPSQDISEMAGTINAVLSPNDVTNFTVTYTHINTLNGGELYREGYADVSYQGMKSWIFMGGVQYMEYNLQAYRSEGGTHPIVYSVTPFADITYRVTEKKSIRAEVQYMATQQDWGSWLFALLEYNIAPKWSFTVSDMVNVSPNADPSNATNYRNPPNNYYSAFVAYTKGSHRFSLAYVKQVDGINCAGGVCRYEPAFSGVKATLTSSF